MTPATSALVLPGTMRDEIVAHARDEAPNECCGVIAGAGGRATRLYRLRNAELGPTFYQIDDDELYRVYRELDGLGWDLLAIYHSHPASPAYPSPTDVSLAFWSDAFFVICSLANPDEPSVRAFQITDGQIAEADVVAD